MRFAKIFELFCKRLNQGTELTVALLLAATIVVTLLQVVFRYGVDSSLSWSEELARYLFIWLIFLGSACAVRRGQHMAVDTLVLLAPLSLRRPLKMLVLAVSSCFFGVVLYTGLLLTQNALYQTSAALEISVAAVYIAAPIGAILALIHLLNGLVQLAAIGSTLVHITTDIS